LVVGGQGGAKELAVGGPDGGGEGDAGGEWRVGPQAEEGEEGGDWRGQD